MRPSSDKLWPEAFWRVGFGALMASLLLVLAACSGGPSLKNQDTYETAGQTVPPVVIRQVIGLPPAKLGQMKTALAVAGGERDIGIVEGEPPAGSFSLSGRFEALVQSAGVRIIYTWDLYGADGGLIQTIAGEDNAGLITGPDPWAVVTTSVIERVARSTMQQMAKRLSQMGYATRLSRNYVPPGEYFAKAGSDAHREVDFETLNGPGMAYAGSDLIAPPVDPAQAMGALAPAPADTQAQQETQMAAAEPEPRSAAKPAKKEGAVEIRAVAVIPVKGSPGNGDAELTDAMRKTLSKAGWPVVSSPQPNAFTIAGHVKVANVGGSQQDVSVRWEVRTPDGKVLGDVKQANRVPAGALDRGWGGAAYAVSEAAAMGIFDIIKRVQ